MEVYDGVEKWNNSHHYTDYSSFQTKSAIHHRALFCFSLNSMPCQWNPMHCQCFTLRQLWHRSDPMVHLFHFTKEQKITLAKSKVGLERQIGSHANRWVPEPRKEGEGSHSFISVSCEQLTASLQALQEQITHLSSGDISADKEDMREIRENNICREAIFLLPHNQWQSCSPGLLRQLCLNKANAITITFILNFLRICLVFFSAQSSFLFKSFFLISWSVVKICWLS